MNTYTDPNPEDVYNELVRAAQETEKLIDEISEMLYNTTISKQDRDMAEYTKLLLEEDKYKFISKAHTLKNLIYYRVAKQGDTSDHKH